MNWKEMIITDPNIMHGQACIKGTRIPINMILDNLATGLTPEEIVKAYPSLTLIAIQAAMAYAAELARERVVTTYIGGSS